MRSVATHGVIDVVSQRPFYIVVSNFNNFAKRFHKEETIAVASGPPMLTNYSIMGELWEERDAASDVNTILIYEKPESRVLQTDRAGEARVADKGAFKHAYIEAVKMVEE